jgi:hypothetical protein
MEQFASQAMTGSNEAINRATEQGLAKINQEAARRGMFKSGGASTQIGNYLAAQSAEQSKYAADLAKSAQEAQTLRLQQAGGIAKGATDEALARAQESRLLGQGLSAEQIGRQGALTGSMGTYGSLQNQLFGTQLSAGQMGESALLNRAAAQSSLAAQDANIGRSLLNDRMGAAQASDAASVARMSAGSNIGNAYDQQRYNYAMGLGNLSQGMDSYNLNKYQTLGGLANNSDAGARANAALQLQAATGLDANTMQGLDSYMRTAGASQAAQEGRLGNYLQAQMGLSGAQANAIQSAYGMGLPAYMGANEAALNAQMNAAQLKAQGSMAQGQAGWKIAGMIASNGASGAGGGAGAAGAGGGGGFGGTNPYFAGGTYSQQNPDGYMTPKWY